MRCNLGRVGVRRGTTSLFVGSATADGNGFGHGKGIYGVCGIMGCDVGRDDSIMGCNVGGVGRSQ